MPCYGLFCIYSDRAGSAQGKGWVKEKMVEPDSAGETLVLLGIIVFQADLQLHCLHKPTKQLKLGRVSSLASFISRCLQFPEELTFLAWPQSPAGPLSQPRTTCLWRPYCKIKRPEYKFKCITTTRSVQLSVSLRPMIAITLRKV